MDAVQPNSESRVRLPGAIQALYPLPPLSWLAPLWSYACGVIASSASPGTLGPGIPDATSRAASLFAGFGGSVLLFMLGLLLAGPLLGVAWAASGQLRRRRELATDPPADAPPKLLGALPFTIPASASYRFASWLGAAATSLQQATPDTAMALLRLVTGGAFSLTVAAALGRRTLAITAMALLYILARSLGREQPARQSVQRGGEGALSKMADILVPILVTWLIGHATRAALRIESVLVATWFALVLWSCSHIHQTGKGLLRLLVPQVLLVAYFIVARQPVTAAGITLLASSQLLWSPLLQTPVGRTRYLRALQLPLAAAALLSAWTLGYGS